uniref:NADH dehydrogenase subunit 6 n=1 Tax=Sipunculus nudus TaxID=6446 RepID=A0A0U1WZL1_SIPNU|nr:NADH dehydrogenase subunit 6 [Sipunculus nudus]AWK60881.1 NADH dehydrogenase subunit 6 [Sipunculus nudus]
MSLLSLISLLLASALALPLAAAPLTLGIWILILGFLSGATISMINSSWMGIITVLIYIGGLNVLFAYFAATAPNKYLFINPMIKITTISSTALMLNMLLYSPTINNTNLYHWTSQFKEMFIGTNVFILLSLGLILFLALVMVVKVANRASGPLRPFL